MTIPTSPKYPTANKAMRGLSSRRAPPRTPRRLSSTQMTIAFVSVLTIAPVTPCTRAKADHWLAKRLTCTIGSEKKSAHICAETRADDAERNFVTQRRIHREARLLRTSSTDAIPARTRAPVLAEASARPNQDSTTRIESGIATPWAADEAMTPTIPNSSTPARSSRDVAIWSPTAAQ